MRLRLDLAYDGTDFHGWAAQPGLRTVQGTLEPALAQVLRVADVSLTCAGRTDSGVHARGQVVHLDVEQSRVAESAGGGTQPPTEVLLRRLNGVLPADVRIHGCCEAAAGFDARFSALWRRYAYRFADTPAAVDPLMRQHVQRWPRRLDLTAMNQASASLLGEHDFAAFCRRRQGAGTVRTLLELTWHRDGDGLLTATVRADAFCHHMVRSVVGCLVAVGEGRRPVTWAGEVLRRALRDPAVTVVPALGLTLEQVAYPPDAELAARAEASRRPRTAPAMSTGAGDG